MYLAWFDANPKKPTAQKIAEARERYVEKFGRKPLVCLVNPDDVITDSAVELRPLKHIGRNCFWIGVDDVEGAERVPSIPTLPEAPRAPRPRKPKAEPVVETTVAAEATAPESAPTPRPRKAKGASVVAPTAAPVPEAPLVATTTAPRDRKPKSKVEPVAPPAPVIVPEPSIVPASKRRARREKAAA